MHELIIMQEVVGGKKDFRPLRDTRVDDNVCLIFINFIGYLFFAYFGRNDRLG